LKGETIHLQRERWIAYSMCYFLRFIRKTEKNHYWKKCCFPNV